MNREVYYCWRRSKRLPPKPKYKDMVCLAATDRRGKSTYLKQESYLWDPGARAFEVLVIRLELGQDEGELPCCLPPPWQGQAYYCWEGGRSMERDPSWGAGMQGWLRAEGKSGTQESLQHPASTLSLRWQQPPSRGIWRLWCPEGNKTQT